MTGAGIHRNPDSYLAASRIRITAEQPTAYRWFTLLDRPRLVLDLSPARTETPSGSLPVADGLVRAVRWSGHPNRRVRVVFDLERPAPHRAFWLTEPPELVVDIDRVQVTLYVHESSGLEVLPLDEYLVGVLAAMMPATFAGEALKAQAVAARTYVLKRLREFGGGGCSVHPGADVCTDPGHCQGYTGPAERRDRWREDHELFEARLREAVSLTSRRFLRYGQAPADAVYHSTCGGHTASASEAWGSEVPYLRGVPCEYCQISPRYRSTKRFSLSDFSRLVGADVLRVVKRTTSGRAQEVSACGRDLTGPTLRHILGLHSTSVGEISGEVVVGTNGYGHGVGLCQWGAEGQARLGRSYREILYYYYSDVTLAGLPLSPADGEGKVDDPGPVPHPEPSPEPTPGPDPAPRPRIVLDPGHGGRDPGAVGPQDLYEKDVNLAVALAAAEVLAGRVDLALTRDRDVTISLRARTDLADRTGALLFVSVHANGSVYPEANGTETFHYPGSRLGSRLAESLQARLLAALGRRDRGVKQADFFVLRETRCPAALVELLFVTNPEEARELADPAVQRRAGEAVAAGILGYLESVR